MANFLFDIYSEDSYDYTMNSNEPQEIYMCQLLNKNNGKPTFLEYNGTSVFYPVVCVRRSRYWGLTFDEYIKLVNYEKLTSVYDLWLMNSGKLISNTGLISPLYSTQFFYSNCPFVLIVKYKISSYSPTAGVSNLVFSVKGISIAANYEHGTETYVVDQDIIIETNDYEKKYTFPRLARSQTGDLFSTERSGARVIAKNPSEHGMNRVIGLIDFLKGTKCDDGYVLALPCFGEQI